MVTDPTRGTMFFIEDDLEQMEADWVDEGLCKLETLLDNHRRFIEEHGA